MRRLSLCASSAKVLDDCIVILQSETTHSYAPERSSHAPERMRLLLLTKNLELETMKELSRFQGSVGFILRAKRDDYLVSIDNRIYRTKGEAQSVILEAKKPQNFFWHAVEAKGRVFVQEYGESPTGIYASEDLAHWERLVSNDALDARSRHFHHISYNPTGDWLLATLGDGALTRVAFSRDLGKTWKPLFRGPWQFVPAVPIDEGMVFGMDSWLARGGVGVYYFKEDRWEFVFSKWIDRKVRYAQMSDLKRIRKDLWVAALGDPQAVIVTKDLRTWHPLVIESLDGAFSHAMSLDVERDIVVCSTGRSVLLFNEEDLEKALASEPVMTEYNPFWDKFVGYGFTLKHRILR